MTAVELEDPAGHVIQEVPVVRDGDDRARVLLQMLLEPLHALGVQVVRRLVEQQQVRLGQQQPAQRHPALLAAGKHADLGVRRWAAQGVHRLLKLALQVPRVPVVKLLLQLAHLIEQVVGVVRRHLLGDLVVPVEQRLGLRDAFLDVPEHRLRLIELRLLLEDPDRESRHEPCLAVGRLLDARHHPQQRRLAGAVRSQDADLGSREERERDVIQDDFVAVRLAYSLHLIDELGHVIKGRGSGRALRTTAGTSGPRRSVRPAAADLSHRRASRR